jgi:hypothetical protein
MRMVMRMPMWRVALLAVVASFVFAQELPQLKTPAPAPEQPLPFSHSKHISNGLECRQCHPMKDPGDFAEIVGTEVCMTCHVAIKTDSPHIQKLTSYHKSGEAIPWQPVYRLPDYLFFSHSVHTKQVGAKCEACHGPVGERQVLARERDISMAACMECHRAKAASIACDFCHETR